MIKERGKAMISLLIYRAPKVCLFWAAPTPATRSALNRHHLTNLRAYRHLCLGRWPLHFYSLVRGCRCCPDMDRPSRSCFPMVIFSTANYLLCQQRYLVQEIAVKYRTIDMGAFNQVRKGSSGIQCIAKY